MEHFKYLKSFEPSRRSFVQIAAASALFAARRTQAGESEVNVFGPRSDYSPQIGTLVSEMTWMRGAVLGTVKGMNEEQA
jgi:hypothetical protein